MKEKKNINKKKFYFHTIYCAVHLSEKFHALINFQNQQKNLMSFPRGLPTGEAEHKR